VSRVGGLCTRAWGRESSIYDRDSRRTYGRVICRDDDVFLRDAKGVAGKMGVFRKEKHDGGVEAVEVERKNNT
jgi:hypothetical protein